MEKKKRKVLKFSDRKVIEELLSDGKDPEEIAKSVGVHRTTIYSELRRCPAGHYTAAAAQETL